MAFSSGSFSRTNGTNTGSTLWASDKTDGTKILASRHDTHDQDLADGINACVLKLGTNIHATSSGTNTVTLTLTPAIASYSAGQTINFKAGGTNTGAVTLNVSSKGAKAIQKSGAALVAGDIAANDIVAVIYDGTQFQMISPARTPVLTSGAIAGTDIAAGSASARGTLELATDAEAVTGSDTARACTPANLTARMAAPGAIGGTTAANGTFATLAATNFGTAGTKAHGTSNGQVPLMDSTGYPAANGSQITALAAGNISSGTVGTARLGSGTASSGTFLRGDSSWVAVTSVSQAAASDIEGETNEDTYIPPDLVRRSPGVCKGWALCDTSGNATISYNVTSCDDNGTGDMDLNWNTDFSTTNHVAIVTGTGAQKVANVVAFDAGSTEYENRDIDSHNVNDPVKWMCAVYGDQ
jgi:hypothetical protein